MVAQPLLSEGKLVVMSPVVAQLTVALVVSLTDLRTNISDWGQGPKV